MVSSSTPVPSPMDFASSRHAPVCSNARSQITSRCLPRILLEALDYGTCWGAKLCQTEMRKKICAPPVPIQQTGSPPEHPHHDRAPPRSEVMSVTLPPTVRNRSESRETQSCRGLPLP